MMAQIQNNFGGSGDLFGASHKAGASSVHGYTATPASFYEARTPVNDHRYSQHDREIDPFARSFGQHLQTGGGSSPSPSARPQRPFSTERMSMSIADVSRNSSMTSNSSFAPRTRARLDAVTATSKALQDQVTRGRPGLTSVDNSADSNTSDTSLPASKKQQPPAVSRPRQ